MKFIITSSKNKVLLKDDRPHTAARREDVLVSRGDSVTLASCKKKWVIDIDDLEGLLSLCKRDAELVENKVTNIVLIPATDDGLLPTIEIYNGYRE